MSIEHRPYRRSSGIQKIGAGLDLDRLRGTPDHQGNIQPSRLAYTEDNAFLRICLESVGDCNQPVGSDWHEREAVVAFGIGGCLLRDASTDIGKRGMGSGYRTLRRI